MQQAREKRSWVAGVRGKATTEELRQALQHYRALFDDLLEAPADEPLSREAAAEHTNKQERTGR